MFDPVDALILDLLEWIGPRPRPYGEVIEAWRTSCPRLPVWEDANARGFITQEHQVGVGSFVSVTAAGRTYLAEHRQRPTSDQEHLNQDPNRCEGFELQPHLLGDLLELRPLTPEDWESLFSVASDPLIWAQHPARDRYKEEVFRQFFLEALQSGGAFVVIDRKTQEIIGSSRYFGFDPAKREIEIGWTFLARSYWGGEYNGEMKRLMLDHAFRFVESVVFLIGPTNIRSQKAMEKIGGVLIEPRKKTIRGETVEQVVYEIKKPTN